MRPSRGAVWGLVLSLVGLGLCVYLTVIHIGLLRGELFGGAVCSAEGTLFNCHAVTGSPVSSLFGMPLSLWGLIGYLVTASLAFIAWQFPDWSAKALTLLAGASLLFVAVDVALFLVMFLHIHYLCPLCLMTYLVNLGLLVVAKQALGKSWREVEGSMGGAIRAFLPQPRVPVVWVFWGMMLTGVLGTVAVNAVASYASQGDRAALRKQLVQFVRQQRHVTVDTTGDPILGSPQAPVQIVEFSDFLCPVCQRASKFNTILLAGRRQDVSFVFKQFPLDMDCNSTVTRTVHAHACQIAAAAECAVEQGKFWAFHDRVFQVGPQYKAENLERDAEEVGLDLTKFHDCLQSGRGLEAVKRDAAEGGRLGINSTPTYIVNGLPIQGLFTPVTFEELLYALHHAAQDGAGQ